MRDIAELRVGEEAERIDSEKPVEIGVRAFVLNTVDGSLDGEGLSTVTNEVTLSFG